MLNLFELGGDAIYTGEDGVEVSTRETDNDEKGETRGQNSACSLEMLSKQTPTPKKIRREALPSTNSSGSSVKAIGMCSTSDTKSTEEDILRLRKRKLQLENIKLSLEIKKLRKDLEN